MWWQLFYFPFFLLQGDWNLYSVTIPTSVLVIGNGAFLDCAILFLVIPTSVTSIEEVNIILVVNPFIPLCNSRTSQYSLGDNYFLTVEIPS